MHLKSACGIGLKPSQEKASLVKGLKATLSLDDLGVTGNHRQIQVKVGMITFAGQFCSEPRQKDGSCPLCREVEKKLTTSPSPRTLLS